MKRRCCEFNNFSKPDSMDAAALNRVGARAVECGKFKQAVALLSNAVEVDPDLAWAWYNLGSAHVGLCGRSDHGVTLMTALQCFQKVRGSGPSCRCSRWRGGAFVPSHNAL